MAKFRLHILKPKTYVSCNKHNQIYFVGFYKFSVKYSVLLVEFFVSY